MTKPPGLMTGFQRSRFSRPTNPEVPMDQPMMGGEPNYARLHPDDLKQMAEMNAQTVVQALAGFLDQHAGEEEQVAEEDAGEIPQGLPEGAAEEDYAMSEPGGTNDFTPGMGGEDPDKAAYERYCAKMKNMPPERMGREIKETPHVEVEHESYDRNRKPVRGGTTREKSQYEREVTDLKREVQALKMTRLVEDRERDLLDLQAQGYLLDVDEEMKDVVGMSREKYERHIKRITTNYSRDITRMGDIPTAWPNQDAEMEFDLGREAENMTMEDAHKAVKYARENNIPATDASAAWLKHNFDTYRQGRSHGINGRAPDDYSIRRA